MTHLGPVEEWRPCTLAIQYSPETDVVQIEGMKFSADLFRGLGMRGLDVGTTVKIVSRDDGVLVLETVSAKPAGEEIGQYPLFENAFDQARVDFQHEMLEKAARAEELREKRAKDMFWENVRIEARAQIEGEKFRAAVDAELARLRGRTTWQRIAEALSFSKKRKSP